MGMYDTIVDKSKGIAIQIKFLDCTLDTYELNDKIDLFDGLYMGYGGYFYVKNNRILVIDNTMINKWGETIDTDKLVDNNNPTLKAIDKIPKSIDHQIEEIERKLENIRERVEENKYETSLLRRIRRLK